MEYVTLLRSCRSGRPTFVAKFTLDSAISFVMQVVGSMLLFVDGYVDGFLQSLRFRGSNVSFNASSFPVFTAGVPVRLLALAMAAVYASRAAVKSAVSCRMASKVMAGVSKDDILFEEGILSNKIIQVMDELDNIVEEEDEEQICFLGGNSSSGTKKYRGSNSSDGGNIRDGVKIAGEVIGSGDEIVFQRVKELLPEEAGKNNLVNEV
ncbi:hypothetical protein Tco_0221449 [Tanacetum coccineum]